MIGEIRNHPQHYLALSLILTFGALGIVFFRFDKLLLNISIYSFGALYVAWGIFHHRSQHHIRPKVVLEYILVALLGTIIIKTLI